MQCDKMQAKNVKFRPITVQGDPAHIKLTLVQNPALYKCTLIMSFM